MKKMIRKKLFSHRQSMPKKIKKPKTGHFARRFHSIKTKFSIVLLLFALIPLIALCIIYTMVARQALSTTSSTLNLEIVRQATNNIDTYIANLETSLTNFGVVDLMESTDTIQRLHSDDPTPKSYIALDISKQLSNFASTFPDLADISLVSDKYEGLMGAIDVLSRNELAALIPEEADSTYCWLIPEELGKKKVLITKSFMDFSSRTKYSLACTLNLNSITSYLGSASLLKDAHLYLATADHDLIFSTDPAITSISPEIASNVIPEKELSSFTLSDSLISYATLSNGWQVIVETPNSSLTEQLDSAFMIVMWLFIVIIVLACLLGSLCGTRFAAPIITLGKLMKRAEEGDLTVVAPVKGNDELTALCSSFNQMMHNIKALINQTQGVIGHALESSESLHTSTNHSVEAIKGLATAVSDIAEGTTTQALNTQKSTEGMADLSSSMEKVTTQTHTLLEHTDGAKVMIENATSTIHSLTETMNSSLRISSHISSSIQELSTLNQNIENVMQLVDNISEETNLLALNASIEAARVGEAGRGFAVVASEVRRLADQSKASTVSVRSTLATITAKMDETVSLASESQQIIKNQEGVVEDTHKLFFQIVSILTMMTSELHTINTSIRDMQTLRSEMVEQIQGIASVTQESAATTEEVSSLATEQQAVISKLSDLSDDLAQHMEELAATIQTFKVN